MGMDRWEGDYPKGCQHPLFGIWQPREGVRGRRGRREEEGGWRTKAVRNIPVR